MVLGAPVLIVDAIHAVHILKELFKAIKLSR